MTLIITYSQLSHKRPPPINDHFLNNCFASQSNTVKPVLSGHRIKQTVAEVPKPLLSGHLYLNRRGHLKSTRNGHFYCCQPALNGHL